MDPQKAWDNLIESWSAREWGRTYENAANLTAWLNAGGFPPEIFSHSISEESRRNIALYACRIAKQESHNRHHPM